jgi:hypothetical protein
MGNSDGTRTRRTKEDEIPEQKPKSRNTSIKSPREDVNPNPDPRKTKPETRNPKPETRKQDEERTAPQQLALTASSPHRG